MGGCGIYLSGHNPDINQLPENSALTRLTTEKSALYDQLWRNELGCQIRLKQEKIWFNWLVEALEKL
jgi:hypothetical protein